MINARARLEQIGDGGFFFNVGERRRVVVDAQFAERAGALDGAGPNMRPVQRAEDALANGMAIEGPLGFAPFVAHFAALHNHHRRRLERRGVVACGLQLGRRPTGGLRRGPAFPVFAGENRGVAMIGTP